MNRDAPELGAAGLRLRGWRAEDAAAVVAMALDPEARTWSASLRSVRTEADAREWITSRRSPDRVDWAVCDLDTAAVVGRASLHAVDPREGTAEVGYAVRPEHRRRGVARRATEAAVDYAFHGLGLARIVLVHAVGNHASCAVAARCGFAYEGTERSALDHGDGVRHDAHRHARLATDPPGRAVPAPAPAVPIEPTEIAAGRLQLRPPSTADAQDALRMLADPEVARWNPGPAHLDLEEVRAWCARGGDWSGGDHATFSVLDATTGRLLGSVSLHQIDRARGDAGLGCRVAPWARGRGVATDAVTAVTRWGFGALGLGRVRLAHAVANPASCRVADKAGLRLEGTMRGSFTDGGLRHDEHLHARLASD